MHYSLQAHLTINALTEDDVDEDVIKDKLSKAFGSNYSIRKKQRKPGDDAPWAHAGSVYQKTKAHAEIAQVDRGHFWQQVQDEQAKMQREEQSRVSKKCEDLEHERKEREAKETAERDRREAAGVSKIRQEKGYEKQVKSKDKMIEKESWVSI